MKNFMRWLVGMKPVAINVTEERDDTLARIQLANALLQDQVRDYKDKVWRLRATIEDLQEENADLAKALVGTRQEVEGWLKSNAEKVEALEKELGECKVHWDAYDKISAELTAINDEQKPVGYVRGIPLYMHPAQVRTLPEGCMWAVTKGGHSICQPPKSWGMNPSASVEGYVKI